MFSVNFVVLWYCWFALVGWCRIAARILLKGFCREASSDLVWPFIIIENQLFKENKLKQCTQTHTLPFYGPLDFVRDYRGEPVPEPIWILLKQETVSGSGISWAICKSAPCPRQKTMPAPHHSVSYRQDAFPATQPTTSKHWGQNSAQIFHNWIYSETEFVLLKSVW